MSFVLVGIGGAIGSVLRYAVALAFAGATFPYATVIVNVVGCFCIGLALPGVDRVSALSPEMRLLFVVGVLGGFTTFSAFGYETLMLLQMNPARAAVNVAASLLAGIAAVAAGRSLAAWVGA